VASLWQAQRIIKARGVMLVRAWRTATNHTRERVAGQVSDAECERQSTAGRACFGTRGRAHARTHTHARTGLAALLKPPLPPPVQTSIDARARPSEAGALLLAAGALPLGNSARRAAVDDTPFISLSTSALHAPSCSIASARETIATTSVTCSANRTFFCREAPHPLATATFVSSWEVNAAGASVGASMELDVGLATPKPVDINIAFACCSLAFLRNLVSRIALRDMRRLRGRTCGDDSGDGEEVSPPSSASPDCELEGTSASTGTFASVSGAVGSVGASLGCESMLSPQFGSSVLIAGRAPRGRQHCGVNV
jgi:hypothetical protein